MSSTPEPVATKGETEASGKRKLPILLPPTVVKGSLRADGSRETIVPADVTGRFASYRKVVFALLIATWIALPWIKIKGNAALFLDIEHRQFYLFGATFNAQDTPLLFFLLTGVGFSLIFVTALLGRIWCGWACPQSVFLDGVYRRIERWLQGPREVQLRRNAAEMSWDKAWRKGLTQVAFVLVSLVIAHIVLSYFTSMPGLLRMVRGSPSDHPEAFAWAAALTGVLYVNFGFFREQLCLAICPYGRLQSVLIDADSLVIGYDEKRGEPRGKASDTAAGACVDCKRCVAVCPTGIDIRNGLQIDCVACTACIDACDEIMDKLHRPRGLIRYTSTRVLVGEKPRVWRPRVALYLVLLVAGAVAFSLAVRKHEDFEANVLRLKGAPYVLDGDVVRDSFEVHLVNKSSQRHNYKVTVDAKDPAATVVLPIASTDVAPQSSSELPIFITMPRARYTHDFPVTVRVEPTDEQEEPHVMTVEFLGAKGGP